MRTEKIRFIIGKIINVLFVAFLLTSMLSIFFEKLFMIFAALGFPFLTWAILSVGCAYSENLAGFVICFALHFISITAIGVLANIAYAKKIKVLRTITYLLILPEIILPLIMQRYVAIIFAVLLQLAVKFMIPFWMPYREKTLYDWEW